MLATARRVPRLRARSPRDRPGDGQPGGQNGTIGEVQAELRRRWRRTLSELLKGKADEGVIELSGDPEDTATLLAQGIAAKALADPAWDRTEAVCQAGVVARSLLAPRSSAASAS